MLKVALFATALVALTACGRAHLQEEGEYALRLDDRKDPLLRDDCGLSASVLTTGTLTLSGNVARFDYQLFKTVLVGAYLSGVERFSVDGSAANVTSFLNGEECVLDLVTLHLDGTTESPSRFRGTFSAQFGSPQTLNPMRCACQVWLRIEAERT